MSRARDALPTFDLTMDLFVALKESHYEALEAVDFVIHDALVLAPDAWIMDRRKYKSVLRPDGYFSGVPELAIVRHTPDEKTEVTRRKIGAYLQHGTRQVWLTNVESKTLYVFDCAQATPTPLFVGQTVSLPAPMPPIAIPIERIFRRDRA